jgi:hypothetical protein
MMRDRSNDRADRELEAAKAVCLRRSAELRPLEGPPEPPRTTAPWRRMPIDDDQVPF